MKQHNSQVFLKKSFQQGLYIIICIPLNKVYIGESKTLRGRLSKHRSTLKRGCHDCKELQLDYDTYGFENFTFQRLYFGAFSQTKEERLFFEKRILETLPPEKRYNLYVDWTSRPSELNSFYGRRHTPEALLANKEAHQGKPSTFKGKKHAPSVGEKISQQNKGMSSMERRKGLYIEGQYYASVSEASRQTGRNRGFIRKACESDREMYKDFVWEINSRPQAQK